MKRFHLFEFEDFPWFPKLIRDGGTDFLGFMLKTMKFYEPVIPILEDLVKETGHHHIVDLCSGNGGPISLISKQINQDMQMRYTLTDKFPNISAYKTYEKETKGRISYLTEPLDVLIDSININGIRTIFTAIHHFKPSDVKIILKNVVDDQMPIAIFDGGNKHIGSILAILLTHPILFLFGTPFITPFKWSRILFTYLIPLIPLYAIWDGMVSVLRLHTPDALLQFAQEVDTEQHFQWSSGKTKNRLGFSVAYLIGKPK